MGYLHIDNLYKNQDILLFKECYAMEKIHGTSAHIRWKDGNILLFAGGGTHKDFCKIFDLERLKEGFTEFGSIDVTIYGEAYGGKLQGMSHTYGKELRFIAFEVNINKYWLSVPDAENVVKKFGLEFVHYSRIPAVIDEIDKERDGYSVQAYRNIGLLDKPREGIVLRPLIEVTKNNGERIISKYKNDIFRETKSPRIITDRLQILTEAEKIANEWVTMNRLGHILQNIPGATIEDTGEVIEMMTEDVVREGRDEIADPKAARKAIGRATSALFKRYLNDKLKG